MTSISKLKWPIYYFIKDLAPMFMGNIVLWFSVLVLSSSGVRVINSDLKHDLECTPFIFWKNLPSCHLLSNVVCSFFFSLPSFTCI